VVVVSGVVGSACGGSGGRTITTLSTTTFTVVPTTTTLSRTARAIASIPAGSETYDPQVAALLLDVGSDARTHEQVVADALSPYSRFGVTALQVESFESTACAPGTTAGHAANVLAGLIPNADPTAAPAVKRAVDLVAVCLAGSASALTAQDVRYVNALANAIAGYVLTRAARAQTPTTTTSAAPQSGSNKDFYDAVCKAGSSAVSAAAWYDALKKRSGGWLGLALVSFGFSYCGNVLGSVLGN
jgi:hypothetical protein